MQQNMLVLILALAASAEAAQRLPVQPTQGDEGKNNPMQKVLDLLTDFRQKTQVEGRREQQSYDKYACWCENTLERKANDINTAKDTVEKLSKRLLQLEAALGVSGAEIKNLKQDIADNQNAQKEATDVRNKEFSDYTANKNEAEQSIQAMEMAIKVLTEGTKAAGKGFLQVQQAHIYSMVEGVRRAVQKAEESQSVAQKDLDAVKDFLDHSDDYVSGKGKFSAAQTGSSNPFGDYSSQSTGIQGILKGMYDTMTTTLEKDDAEEANHEKSFREIMATKNKELSELNDSLEAKSEQHADDNKEHAESKKLRRETSAQLAADEKFFDETKTGCRNRAKDWATRSRLRSEEIRGIDQAVKIIESNQSTFFGSYHTFLQINKHTNAKHTHRAAKRDTVFKMLKTMTQKFGSYQTANIAAAVKTGGTFDKVIEMIDKLLESLNKEMEEDVFHKDRCEMAMYKSHYESQGLIDDITRLQQEIKRLDALEKKLEGDIAHFSELMAETKKQMKELEDNRKEEYDTFRSSLEDDKKCVELIGQVIESLGKFYQNNGISLLENAKDDQGPKAVEGLDVEYTVDRDKAPELNYDGANYGGRQGTNRDIVSILEHIRDDTKLEIKDLRDEDKADEADYHESYKALKETYDEQNAQKVNAETHLAELQEKEAGKDGDKDGDQKALSASKLMEKALARDCDWVNTHFDDRRTKRQAEMDGLQTAKEFLMGKEAANTDEDLDSA